jgi:hypothetical protein
VKNLINFAFEGQSQQFEFWGNRADGRYLPKSVSYRKACFLRRSCNCCSSDITVNKILEEV